MEILINDERTVTDIQEDFTRMFPYLKLEFFNKTRRPSQAERARALPHGIDKLACVRNRHATGEIAITPELTVLELEQQFSSLYNLGIQVFRKSGRSWLATTVTSGWTLRQQNAEGEELSTGYSDAF